MPTVLLTGIGLLASQTAEYGDLLDAALIIEGGRIAWVGPGGSAPDADEQVDLAGRCVLPGFVDSHAHLVFAGDRSAEFSARMSFTHKPELVRDQAEHPPYGSNLTEP